MQEGADVLALLDHLGLEQAAILGTSRGRLIGMYLAVIAKDRLRGLFLNDIGPVIEPEGLDRIDAYIGRNPAARSHGEAAMALARAMPEFDVPASRWAEEARKHFIKTDQGLQINYDPALRDAYLAARAGGAGDLWPMFAACEGLPLAVIRGADSALLSATTLAEMTRLRPDMVVEEVPGAGMCRSWTKQNRCARSTHGWECACEY